jgi:hypothetical protein
MGKTSGMKSNGDIKYIKTAAIFAKAIAGHDIMEGLCELGRIGNSQFGPLRAKHLVTDFHSLSIKIAHFDYS